MDEELLPIETPLGLLNGRDCIFVDKVDYDVGSNSVVLYGEINGNLCSRDVARKSYIPYRLQFDQVYYFLCVELDCDLRRTRSTLSLARVKDSTLIAALRSNDFDHKLSPLHSHYYVVTYDDVFEIVSAELHIAIGDARVQEG